MFVSVMLISIGSCQLQSDEELRKDIIGVWKVRNCKYPHTIEPDYVNGEHPLRGIGTLVFGEDGSVTNFGTSLSCVLDSCDDGSDGFISYCTCEWSIEEGNLHITTDTWFPPNFPFPIKCLNKNVLVFDNMNTGVAVSKKACFYRE